MKTIFTLLVLFISFLKAEAQRQFASLPPTDHKWIVIAHRGDHLRVPENTLAAYRQAIACGADYVEVDLRTTKDGHLVVMHDATVDKMTNGKGEVKDLLYEEIKKLVIRNTKVGDQKIYRVPDFKSVLKTCKDHINIYLDFKDADVSPTYALIKKTGMEHHVVVYLNKEDQYDAWKKAAPEIPLMASLPEKMSLHQLDSLLNKKEINIVDNAYDPEEIKFLHQKGIAIWLDVESEYEDSVTWKKMLSINADGLQTDHPKRLIQYLKKKNLR